MTSLKLPKTNQLSTATPIIPVLVALLIFLINFSGDHIFNKTNTLKLVLLALSCLVLMTVFFLKQRSSDNNIFCNSSIPALLTLPVLSTIPGLYFTEGKYSYGFSLELTSQVLCILWCFLIYALFDTKSQIEKFWTLFSITIIYVCLIALFEKLGLDPLVRFFINPFESYWSGEFIVYDGFHNRVKSTFGNINYFAGWLIQLIPVYLAFLVLKAENIFWRDVITWKTFLPMIIIIFLLVSIALTETRSAIASMLISLLVFFSIYLGKFTNISFWKSFLGISVVTSVLFGLMLLFNQDFLDRAYSLLNISAWESRFVPWRAAYYSILNAPLLGYGLGSSYQLFFEYVQEDLGLFAAGSSYNHVHLEWLEILQEGGLFGLSGYLVFWLAVFWFGIQYIINNTHAKDNRVLMLGLLAGLLGYHLHGFFSVAPRMIIVRSMAYLLVAFVFILVFKIDGKGDKEKKECRGNRFTMNILMSASLILSCAWLIPYFVEQHQFARGLALEAENPAYLTELALESEDVYILNHASYLLAEQKKAQALKLVSTRLESIFPNYRDNIYFLAYSEYLLGNMLLAKEIAERHQNTDKFNEQTNQLLAAISLQLNDRELFKRQLLLAITKSACNLDIVDQCSSASVELNEGRMAAPIQFIGKNNMLYVYLDKGIFSTLSEAVNKQRLTRQDDISALVKPIIKQVGYSRFFIPDSLMQENKELGTTLRQYISGLALIDEKSKMFEQRINLNYKLSLFDQINDYKLQKSVLTKNMNETNALLAESKTTLESSLNLDDLMKRRDLLREMSTWFVLTLNHVIN